ncbi:MAG TPA: PAS domain S-box protein [Burkholderiales bacterium]
MTEARPVGGELLAAVFEVARIGIVFVDDSGRMVDVNPAFCSMLGYPREEVVGRSLLLVAPPEVHAAPERYLKALLSESPRFSTEWSMRRRDGTFLTAVASWRTVQRPDGGRVVVATFTDISARKAAEEEVRSLNEALEARIAERTGELGKSEERYRNVTENIGDGILVVQDARFAYANRSLLALLGYTWDEVRGRDFMPFVHPDFRALVLENYRRRLAGQDVAPRYEFQVLNRQGDPVWVELGAVVIQWDGRPATLSFLSDIRERKHLEERLRASLAERETILDKLLVGIAFLDAKGRQRWVNSAMLRIFRADSREDWVGKSLESLYPSREVYLETGAAVLAAVSEGKPFQRELLMRRTDGTQFWALLAGRAVNEGDLSQGTVWTIIDISRRKGLEEEVRRASAEREVLLQSALVGITHTNERRHLWVNQKFCEMTGYSRDELLGASSRLIHPDEDSWRRFGELAYPVLARGDAFDTEWRIRRKDGSLLWAHFFGRMVDPADAGRGTIWTFVDISERKKAEEDIRAALERQRELNTLKSRFVSMTSHEFRTPLSAILSSAQLLKLYGGRLPAPEREGLLAGIEASVKRMAQMLDDILTIGRADAGMLEFQPADVDVRAVCQSVTEEARAATRADHGDRHRIELQMDGVPQRAVIDERLLRQILGNLLSNAVKYSPAGGLVGLAVRADGTNLDFQVSDEGIGLEEEDVPRLFETFFRASNTGNIPGTGLGLAIVKRATELHGGTVAAQRRPGGGTCFRVTIPLRGA